MSLCPHGINTKHKRCYHCEDIAAAEMKAAERQAQKTTITRCVACHRRKAYAADQKCDKNPNGQHVWQEYDQ